MPASASASASTSAAAFDGGPEQDLCAKDGTDSSTAVDDVPDSHSSLSSPSSVSNEPLASSSDEQADDSCHHHLLRLCDSDDLLEGPSRLPVCQVVMLRYCEHYISLCSLSKKPITMISVRHTLPWSDASDASEGVCQVIAATGPKPEVVQGS